MKQVSLSCIILILISSLGPIRGQNIKVIDAWITRCFTQGYYAMNSTSMSCDSMEFPQTFLLVPELKVHCAEYYKFGCETARLEIFCRMGISQALSDLTDSDTNFSCNELEISEDITNHAFECCISCKGGITDSLLNDKCLFSDQVNHGERSRQTCCQNAVSLRNGAVNVNKTIIESTSPPPSKNFTFDEISTLVDENDLKISSSISNIMKDNPIDLVTSITVGTVNGSSDATISSSTINPTTEGEFISTSAALTTTSTEVITITPETIVPTSTSVTVSTREINCSRGYQLSSESNTCQDQNECENADICPNAKCFNFPGSYKCCPLGTEFDPKNTECFFVDYCEKDPCYEDPTDHHYCVNYFTGRECIDKLEEGYQFLNGESGIMELSDKKDDSSPRYLELTVKNITLKDTPYENHGLIFVHLPKNVQCEWDFKLDEAWAPNENDELSADQFHFEASKSSKFNQIKVWINGQVKPQSIATSVTCSRDSKPFYRNRIYFTFNPKSKN